MNRQWTNLERFVFLIVAWMFMFVQAIALLAMAYLWLFVGPWALVGLTVVLPPLWPVSWLLRQALLKRPDAPILPALPIRLSAPSPATAPDDLPAELDLSALSPEQFKEIFGKGKGARIVSTT